MKKILFLSQQYIIMINKWVAIFSEYPDHGADITEHDIQVHVSLS